MIALTPHGWAIVLASLLVIALYMALHAQMQRKRRVRMRSAHSETIHAAVRDLTTQCALAARRSRA